MLYPSAQLSKSSDELIVQLSDDYFNQVNLDSAYFVLNNAPSGVSIASVSYVNASRAVITLSGSLNVRAAAQVSVTIKAEMLNGYEDVTTNEVPLSSDVEQFTKPQVSLYATPNTLHMKCSQPKLLGNQLMLYNVSGKRIRTLSVGQQQVNRFQIHVIPGVYCCRYELDGIVQTQKVVITR
jgi:hypothetical protein